MMKEVFHMIESADGTTRYVQYLTVKQLYIMRWHMHGSTAVFQKRISKEMYQNAYQKYLASTGLVVASS